MAGSSREKTRLSKMIRFERGLPRYPCLCWTGLDEPFSELMGGEAMQRAPSGSDGDRGRRVDFAAAVPVWHGQGRRVGKKFGVPTVSMRWSASRIVSIGP
jgi:hypothetical protein